MDRAQESYDQFRNFAGVFIEMNAKWKIEEYEGDLAELILTIYTGNGGEVREAMVKGIILGLEERDDHPELLAMVMANNFNGILELV